MLPRYLRGPSITTSRARKTLGEEVVDAYFERGVGELRALLSNESIPPLMRLNMYFDERIRGYRAGGYLRGCLMGNLSLEVADHSVVIRERLATHFKTWAALFENCIAQAQATAAIGTRLPAPLLAQFILNSWEGALLRMRAEQSDAPLYEFKEVVFRSVLA